MHRGAFIKEKEFKSMIKLSYTELSIKLKKRAAAIAAIMCVVTTASGCGSYNAELTWEIEESTVSEEADIDSTMRRLYAHFFCLLVGVLVSYCGVYRRRLVSWLYSEIEAAGGMTEGADPYYLNQAKVLEDAEQIIVLTTQEVQERKQQIQHEEEEAGLVNINTADVAQLMQLNGIGQSRAEAIVAYREQCGRFTQIEDIQMVTGIKAGLYEKIKDKITVG